MSDFLTATWSLATGLSWLWAFLLVLLVACLAVSGGIFWLDVLDRALRRRRRSRRRPVIVPTRREVRRG